MSEHRPRLYVNVHGNGEEVGESDVVVRIAERNLVQPSVQKRARWVCNLAARSLKAPGTQVSFPPWRG